LVRRYGERGKCTFSESETLQLDVTPLKAIARLHEPGLRYDPLWAVCPKELLLSTRSDQSAQQPAIGRAVALYQADRLAGMLENIFNSLAPTGEVVQQLRRQGWIDEHLGQRIRVVFVLGTEGGTGSGVLLLSALIAHSVATVMQLSCEFELVFCGDYRSTIDRESTLRRALGEQVCFDLDLAQTTGNIFKVKTLNGMVHTAATPLFNRIMPFQGNGRLNANADALALLMAQACCFRATSIAAAKIDLGHAQNILSRNRLRSAL
jgi:hypothetical protein